MEKKLNYVDGRNLSCQYLSSKIKKNDGYINRIINGKINPSFKMLFDIASALRVSVSELFE